MRSVIRKASFVIAVLFLQHCNKPDAPGCLRSTGKITRESRPLEAIRKINLDDNINLVIYDDSIPKIEVEAGENLIANIKTEREGDVLKIYNDNSCNFMRRYDIPVTVFVHTPVLREIYYNGGGKITSGSELNYPYLLLESWNSGSEVFLELDNDSVVVAIHTGVSNIDLKGKTGYLYLYSAGNSIFHAEEMIAPFVHCNNGSTGDFFVNATNELHVEVRSYSTTWYKGNPVLTVVGPGTGKVERL